MEVSSHVISIINLRTYRSTTLNVIFESARLRVLSWWRFLSASLLQIASTRLGCIRRPWTAFEFDPYSYRYDYEVIPKTGY